MLLRKTRADKNDKRIKLCVPDATDSRIGATAANDQKSSCDTISARAKLAVNSTHHQAVGQVASPLQAVAASSDGIVEGLELHPDAAGWLPFLLGVQFHPERLADRYAEHRSIFRVFTRACARSHNTI